MTFSLFEIDRSGKVYAAQARSPEAVGEMVPADQDSVFQGIKSLFVKPVNFLKEFSPAKQRKNADSLRNPFRIFCKRSPAVHAGITDTGPDSHR